MSVIRVYHLSCGWFVLYMHVCTHVKCKMCRVTLPLHSYLIKFKLSYIVAISGKLVNVILCLMHLIMPISPQVEPFWTGMIDRPTFVNQDVEHLVELSRLYDTEGVGNTGCSTVCAIWINDRLRNWWCHCLFESLLSC